MLLKIYKYDFEFKTEQTKDTKTKFCKRISRKCNLYKSEMNKIITKYE